MIRGCAESSREGLGMYAPLDDAVYDAAAEAEAALAALASALLAIEAAEARRCKTHSAPPPLALKPGQHAAVRAELQGAVGLEPAESAQPTASCQAVLAPAAAARYTRLSQRARQREALLEGASGVDPDKVTPSTLIAIGLQVQLESQLAVSRMTRTVEATKQLGASTMASLDAQHSAWLERLRDTAGAQEAQFAQVERELRELAAGALQATVTQVLLALILLSICFLISWRLSRPDHRARCNGDGRELDRRAVAERLATDGAVTAEHRGRITCASYLVAWLRVVSFGLMNDAAAPVGPSMTHKPPCSHWRPNRAPAI